MHMTNIASDQRRLVRGYSLEVNAHNVAQLTASSALIPAGTLVPITYLPSESMEARIAAVEAVRSLGFVPVPHIAARRFRSTGEMQEFLGALAARAAIDRVFVIAGDVDRAAGPFNDSLSLIQNAGLRDYGVRTVGIAGYPEGHPQIPAEMLRKAMFEKIAALSAQGIDHEVVSQFTFDAQPVLQWAAQLRADGVSAPLRIGIPGSASVGTLLRFAARCGVGATARGLAKYGISMTRLLATAAPDKFVEELAAGLSPSVHGVVAIHLYTFGGIARSAEWASRYLGEAGSEAPVALASRQRGV